MSDASSTGEDRYISSCRLSRVPVRLISQVWVTFEGREAPKKSSIASVVSSTETRVARDACVNAGAGCASCASTSISCEGVAERSKRPKKAGREVEEEAMGEDIARWWLARCACQEVSGTGDGWNCSKTEVENG